MNALDAKSILNVIEYDLSNRHYGYCHSLVTIEYFKKNPLQFKKEILALMSMNNSSYHKQPCET